MFTFYKDLERTLEKLKMTNECPKNISLLSVLYLLLDSLLDLYETNYCLVGGSF